MIKEARLTSAILLAVCAGLGACDGGPDTENDSYTVASSALTTASVDNGDVSAWHDFASAGSTVTHGLSSSRPSSSTTSMKIAYTLATGGYGGVERLFSTPMSWSAYAGVQMWVYGAATGHVFTVQVYEQAGERFEATFTVDFSGWKLITLPFTKFAQTAWQPPGAQSDGRLETAAISGMALLPARSGAAVSSAVSVDALAVVDVAAATVPPGTATGSQTGTIVPLYSYPTSAAWTTVVAAKTAHPSIPVLAVVNPANGPSTTVNPSYTSGIARLVAAGVTVVGYTHTSYGARAAADVQADILRWKQFYPQVTGIFLDEMSNVAGYESYYRNLTAYAKTEGFAFTIGNPGTDTVPSFVASTDVILVYESAGLPNLSSTGSLGGWHASYDRHYFGVIPYAVSSVSSTFVQSAKQSFGYIYLQNDTLPNPWDTVPSYFDQLVGLLP